MLYEGSDWSSLFFRERVYIKSPLPFFDKPNIHSNIICEYPFEKFQMPPFYRWKESIVFLKVSIELGMKPGH
jgi:hypothetical protein